MFCVCYFLLYFFFFKQKTAYDMRISDWSSDVCSSDLLTNRAKEADELSGELATELKKPDGGDPARVVDLVKELDAAQKWGPGGEYRLIATAIMGGAAGNVTGGVTEAAQASAVNYLQGLTTQQLKLYPELLGEGPEAQAPRPAPDADVACAAGSDRK